MGVTECPFFPGKICYGTCPNNEDNVKSIEIEASVLSTSTDNVRVARNLSFSRFFEAKIAKFYNYDFYDECERRPVN